MPIRPLVLSLSANPRETGWISLDEEARAIDISLGPDHERRIELQHAWAVRFSDLPRLLLRQPAMLYFAGHGLDDQGLRFANQDNKPEEVSGEALARLLKVHGESIRLAILNACDTATHAEALTQVVDCAIGTTVAIAVDEARKLAVALFQAIDRGDSVGAAFRAGAAALKEPKQIVLHARRGVDPEAVYIASADIAKRPVPPGLVAGPKLYGRDAEVTRVVDGIRAGMPAQRTVIAIAGLAGSGKTSVAREAAWSLIRRGTHDILWLSGSKVSWPANLIETSYHLDGGSHCRASALRTIAEEVASGRVLFVDGADDPEVTDELSSIIYSGCYVVSTRNTNLRCDIRVDLAGLAVTDAISMLCTQSMCNESEAAAQLARHFGYLPIALAFIADFARNTATSLSEFVRRVLASDAAPLHDVFAIVEQAVGPTLDLLAAEEPTALRCLELFAAFEIDRLPRVPFAALVSDVILRSRAAPPMTRTEVDLDVAVLRRHSLIEATSSHLAIHLLVREIVNRRIASPLRTLSHGLLLLEINKLIAQHNLSTDQIDTCEAITGILLGIDVAHLARTTSTLPNVQHNRVSDIAQWLGRRALFQLEDPIRAIPLFARAIAERGAAGNVEINDLLRFLSNAHSLIGEHEKARYYIGRAESSVTDERQRQAALHDAGVIELNAGNPLGARNIFLRVLNTPPANPISHARSLDNLGKAELSLAASATGAERAAWQEEATRRFAAALQLRVAQFDQKENALGAANLARALTDSEGDRGRLLLASQLLAYAAEIYAQSDADWSEARAAIATQRLNLAVSLDDFGAAHEAARPILAARRNHKHKRRTKQTRYLAWELACFAVRQRRWAVASDYARLAADLCFECPPLERDLAAAHALLRVIHGHSSELPAIEFGAFEQRFQTHPDFDRAAFDRHYQHLLTSFGLS